MNNRQDLNFLKIVILAMESEIVKFGYTEDEICAMDIEEDCLKFFMSDGKVVTMKVSEVLVPSSFTVQS